MVFRISDVVVDEPIAPERFVFKPGPTDFEVDEFDPQATPPLVHPLELIGKPAPDFSAATLDGKSFALRAARERVVVLHFWAAWNFRAREQLVELQKLGKRFAESPVTIIGVNRDEQTQLDQVKSALREDEISLAQIHDADAGLARRYRVASIPATILIDRWGVLAEAHLRYGEDFAETLAAQIEKLLKDERLYSEDEVAERIEEFEESSGGIGGALPISLEESGGERLVPTGAEEPLNAWGFNARFQDLDGDGAVELLLPSWQGALHVISGDGTTVRKVRISGAGAATQIQSINVVELDQRRYWFLSTTRSIQEEGARWRQVSTVGLYSEDGHAVWRVQPQLDAEHTSNMTAAAGDLDGDGRPEFVVGVTAYRTRAMGDNSWTQTNQRAHLIVLDRNGRPIAQRRIGQQIALVHIARPAGPGKPALLLVLADGKLHRFRLRGDSKTDSPTTTRPGEPENR
jgi:peroxiredoxin